jgi:hypothetical protein
MEGAYAILILVKRFEGASDSAKQVGGVIIASLQLKERETGTTLAKDASPGYRVSRWSNCYYITIWKGVN